MKSFAAAALEESQLQQTSGWRADCVLDLIQHNISTEWESCMRTKMKAWAYQS